MVVIFIHLAFANHAVGPKCFSQGYRQKAGIQIFITKCKYKDNEESTNSSIDNYNNSNNKSGNLHFHTSLHNNNNIKHFTVTVSFLFSYFLVFIILL